MAIMIDSGSGGGGVIIIINSTEGAGANTSVTTGSYSGSSAKIVETHAVLDKVGVLCKPYDPLLAALLAMNF